MTSVPQRARVVVIGGGVIGTSVAYHLAALGWTDIVLLERDRLTSGTTWHAAGLMVTFGSLSETSTEMRKYTRDLYARLEAETGQSTGLKQVGFIEVTPDPDRLEEYRRVSAFNRLCGVDVQEISPGEVKEMFPLARTDDLLAGFYVADDGRANPVDVTMALGKGARQRGATILEGVPALAVLTARRRGHRRAHAVRRHRDGVRRQLRRHVGPAARRGGRGCRSRCRPPSTTTSSPSRSRAWTARCRCWRTPSSYGYFREEGAGLMIGLFEAECAPWHVDRIPESFSFGTIPPDWDRMAPYLEKAMSRVPVSFDAGVRTFFCGPESFTPDLSPIVGEAPEVRNYFVAAGLNSIGILTGGGIGRAMAHWIVDGRPDIDVTGMNIDRLHAYQSTPAYRAERTVESLGHGVRTALPRQADEDGARRQALADQRAAGRPPAPTSGTSAAGRAPDWYAPEGVEPVVEKLSWGRQNWFPYWEAEHRAAREGVILMDMSFMAKFLVQGRDAGTALDHLSAGAVNGEPGVITYTQWLNEGGTLEADLTVTKLDDDRFWVVASDTAHRHAETWMRRRVRRRARVRHGRHVGLRADQHPGPALARAAGGRHIGRPVQRGVPVPRRPARSTSASPACCASGSPTWASWATSCTSRPSRRCTCTTAWSPPARPSACGTRA